MSKENDFSEEEFGRKLDEMENLLKALGIDIPEIEDDFPGHLEWLEHEESVSKEGESGAIRLIRSNDGKVTGVEYLDVELEGTQYEGRIERIENIREGDLIQLKQDPDNPYMEDAIHACNAQGESLGLIPNIISEGLTKSLNRGWEKVVRAFVTLSEPLSQRDKRAKRPILHVTIETEIQPEACEDMDEDEDDFDYLGMKYLNGYGVDPDPEKAAYWFEKGAEAGIPSHMFNMGLFYAKGFGVSRDFNKAAEWMQKAAENGDQDAFSIAEKYTEMTELIRLAENGNIEAQAALAEEYMKLANSLEQADNTEDYMECIRWATKAAEQNNPKAYWILGLAWEKGRGVAPDDHKAFEMFEKGAELGNAQCQNNLANYYAQGTVVKKNMAKAFELYQKSAEQGYGPAMSNIGRCYQFAKGTTGNMGKAVEWYEKSLSVLPNPELANKVQIFKSLGQIDPSFNDDYPQADDNVDDEAIVNELVNEMKNGTTIQINKE